jgi:hypothetical protein
MDAKVGSEQTCRVRYDHLHWPADRDSNSSISEPTTVCSFSDREVCYEEGSSWEPFFMLRTYVTGVNSIRREALPPAFSHFYRPHRHLRRTPVFPKTRRFAIEQPGSACNTLLLHSGCELSPENSQGLGVRVGERVNNPVHCFHRTEASAEITEAAL